MEKSDTFLSSEEETQMKRIISFVLCLSMLLSMLPVNVFAADVDQTTAVTEPSQAPETEAATEAPEPETTAAGAESAPETVAPDVTDPATEEADFAQAETEASETEEAVPEETFTATGFTWVPELELPSDEELFAVYAERQFYGSSVSLLGTSAGETLDEPHKLVYDLLAGYIREIASGERESTIIAVGQTLGDVTVTTDSGEQIVVPCTPETESDLTGLDLDLQNLLSVLLADFPYELYWFDKTAGISVWPITSTSGKSCYVFYFTVSNDYSLSGSEGTYDVDTTITGATATAVENARAIVASYAASSDYEKLTAYRDEICALTSYNSSAASSSYDGGYGDPWQLIWVFDQNTGTNVVCEGYSKAFQYLCDLSEFDNDITCYSVVGTINGGAHMWNILRANGSSYMVDVTNSDSGTIGSGGGLFLVGGTPSSSGVYSFAGASFIYDSETTSLWGTGEGSILTLSTTDLDPDSLTVTPDPEPSTPETEPDDGEESSAMTGEELVAAMESASGEYVLETAVVIDTEITLPSSVFLNVYSPGSITVKNGGSLTIPGSMGVSGGGVLTVEAGGTVTVDGNFAMGGGGSATIDGTLINNNYVNIGWGTLVVNGTYTAGENAHSTVDFYGSISGDGIDKALFDISATVYDEASLISALAPMEGYASQSVYVVNYDMDSDGTADPVVLTQNVTVPAGIDLQVGYYTGNTALLRISNGASLTVDGTMSLISDGTVLLDYGATLVNNNYIYNNGTITSCGTITGNGTFDGNAIEESMSLDTLLALLETLDEVAVTVPMTLTEDLTIPAGKTVSFEDSADVTVSGGAVLTVEGNLNCYGTALTVQSGSSLILRGNGYLFGGSALTIEDGASFSVEDNAEIYASIGTVLTGITKADVVNSNMILDPADDLQTFAEIYGAGYKKFYLSISTDTDYTVSTDMTLDSNIALDHFGLTVTITNGATLTINGNWAVGMDATAYGGGQVPGYIVVEDGNLVINGNLDLLYGSTLTVDETYGTVTGSGTLNGSEPIDKSAALLEEFLADLNDGGDATVNGTITLTESLTVGLAEGALYIPSGSSLTVPEGVTLTLDCPVYIGGELMLDAGSTLNVAENAEVNVLGGGTLFNCGAMTVSESASLFVYGSLSGDGSFENNGLLYLGELDGYTGYTDYYVGTYTHGQTACLTVELVDGYPLFCELIPTTEQDLIHVGCDYVMHALDYAADYASVLIYFTGELEEDSLGYVLMPLDDSDLLTIPENVTLNLCTTVYIPDITVDNQGTLNVGAAELPGQLILCGVLNNLPGSSLTVWEGSTMTVDASGTMNNEGSVTVFGTLAINGPWEGNQPEAAGNGSIDMGEMPDQQEIFENMISGVDEATLTYDLELVRNLYVGCTLIIDDGVTLTVPEGVTMLNEGRIILIGDAALVVNGKLLGNLPYLTDSSSRFDYADGSLSFTQDTLEAQLAQSVETGMPVYVSVPLTLTKDLVVPAGAVLMLSGGTITIPSERSLINNGIIQMSVSGGITAQGTGTLENNSIITVMNRGKLDMTHGSYVHGDDAQLVLCYFNEGPGTGTSATLIGNIYEYVTFQVEGWDEDQLRSVMSLAENMMPIQALQINVCGELTLAQDLVLPEYATLYIGDLGYGPATLTVPKNKTLTNNGCIRIGSDGTLIVQSKGKLVGNLPICSSDTAVYDNQNTQYLEGQLSASTTLTGPTVVTGTLEIPAGTALTISGEGAYLLLTADAQLINHGTITVEKAGILDVTSGSYVGSPRTVSLKSICDVSGNITHGTVCGISAGDLKFVAETYSDDQVIRDTIGYVNSLVESGEIPDPEMGGFFAIRFVGETELSADLELPYYCDPIIPVGGSLTVPAGMTLTDHSGMGVYGTLIAEGQVIATGWPIMVASEENLVNPQNCTNFYYDDLALEAITVTADRDTAAVGQTIALTLEGWTPEHAKYFGYYEVSFDTEDFDGCDWTDEGDLLVYSDTPGDLTVTITATDEYGEILTNSAGEAISVSVTLHFVEKQFYLYITEAPDFYENADYGICGLYPGGSLTYFANTTGAWGEVDSSICWPDYSAYSDYITATVENGMLTITAKENLPGMMVIDIRPMTDDPSVAEYSEPLYLRPSAESVDITLNGETVTGQTVLFDLNRNPDSNSVTLSPIADPAEAYAAHLTSGKQALVSWSSSNTKVATVEEDGTVTFTGTTGTAKITMTTAFGSQKTAVMTFNVVALPQEICSSERNVTTLIGGSSTAYTVTDETGAALKSSAVKWFLCDKDGQPITSHPYAAVTAAGKLTTKAVADETKVYLMAQVIGDNASARLSEPVLVTLFPAISSVQILDAILEPANGKTLLYDVGSLGLEYPLSWTAAPYLESVKSVSWKSSKPAVAQIDETGLITVADYDASGTVKFTLTVVALNNKKSTATVTMKFGTFTQDLLLSAKLPDGTETDDLTDLMIYSGESITFRAENDPAGVTTTGVKWALDCKTYATISAKGVLKAKTVSNPVVVSVLVTSKDGACGYEIPVIILPKPNAVVIWNEDEVFITKTTQTMEAGESTWLYASEDVTWSSSKPGIAAVDPDTGYLEAFAKGSTTITATTADGRKATFTLKVSLPFASMTITTKKGEPFAVASGKSLNLVGTVEYLNGTTSTKVTWKVSDTSLATISSAGKLTAAKGLTRAAAVTVTATAKDSTWSTSRVIQVLPLTTAVEVFGPFGGKYPVDISNTTQKWDLNDGTGFSLSARTFPEGAMENVTWKSSSAKIATVDKDGNVTCLKAGTVTITATAADGSGKKASFKLTVHKTMTEGSLQLPESAFIAGGKSLTMTKLDGYAIDAAATNKTLSWTVAYPNGAAVPKTVATLSSKGVLKTKAVTAPVVLKITASATDGSGECAECIVTIYPATKGVTLYNVDMDVVTKKTVTVPVNLGYTVLPDTTNVKGFGYTDDMTADEYLANGAAWTVTLSKQIATVEFDGQAMTVYADGATAGQSVKITLKANDGSGKSAYFTVKFTDAAPE